MTDDRNLSVADVQALATKDGVSAFFAAMGYRTDSRQPQSVSAMGITAGSLSRQIKHIERIAVHDDGAESLDTYLIELTSVTMAAIQGLVRVLRNRAGNYLLVLTDDYERLDFVLLQRTLPGTPALPMTVSQVAVRPRILTISRRNPTQVQLRVLRRFTYTELDSDAQYDKLLSAYTVAEWSEPFFNNRALFSDYYLNGRLPELAEWRERPEDAYHHLLELLSQLQRHKNETGDRATALVSVESAIEILGFKAFAASGDNEPDYRLYAPDNLEKPVAVCLSYAWNRYLDGRDETRDIQTPDENPSARVVTVLESGEAPWAIVTNGKLWRLYSARTHSRSTNYYEIDLGETLAMADPNEAFRYFWLFFRQEAFVTKETQHDGQIKELSFLDRLLEDSERYAKVLGERLKERVFEQVFPHFARGFIEHLKGQAGMVGPRQVSLLSNSEQLALKREPDEEFHRQVFNGTLTLLYRLLFLLYAESRDLLPVKEVRGYWERSLTKLKEDIAEKAGPIVDTVPERLDKAYRASADATKLYDRLLNLFSVIGLGSRDLNVPRYNGGLFITKPHDSDHTLEAETARFLASHKIPDRYLALALDLLARDLDDKRQDLVFIDYKSLGVRQLGSIYEGLLELKVRVAPEKMAVVKGKNAEEVIPYEEAVKSRRRVLTIGRGRKAQERVYQTGEVYLENDRRERKASGSYYTPDHIVKYIVENTVGPVLAGKFDKLRPKFRNAQQDYRTALDRTEALRKQGMKSDDPAEVANRYADLVDDLFDLKVLDPAMGSGHFLVEAVDFICDRILGEHEGFLRAFPWNPVTRFLQDTREAIISDMARQGVAVDTGRLTDINLLKRHILKRCTYGVDLNPMAVELAKVSLWLDCFTIGAPLSFLDHHLKHGNSLIGTTVQEIESELATQSEGHFNTLFGGPFQGLLSATASIEQLRRIPDATVAEAERSQSLYTEFEIAQSPYKAALHIWVSSHFGNAQAQGYLTLAGPNLVDQIRSGGESLPPDCREAIAQGTKIGTEKSFFHWDLEYPEAFVDLEKGTWKPNQEQGFDAVIGNPPYVSAYSRHSQKHAVSEEGYFFHKFRHQLSGRLNTFLVFLVSTTQILRRGGYCAMVIPDTFIYNESYGITRQHLVSNFHVCEVLKCTYPVFEDSTVGSAVPVIRCSSPNTMRMIEARKVSDVEQRRFSVDSVLDPNDVLTSPSVRFPFVSNEEFNFLKQVEENSISLGELCNIRDGVNPGPKFFREVILDPSGLPKPTWRSLLEGKNIHRYSISNPTRIVDYDSELLTSALKKKGASFREAWIFEENKIVSRQTADRIIAAFDHSDAVGLNSAHFTRLKVGTHYSHWYILACLNSHVMNRYYQMQYQETRSTFPQVHISTLRKLPIPEISATPLDRDMKQIILQASQQILTFNSRSDPWELIDVSNLQLATKRRALHDLISILARHRSRSVKPSSESVEAVMEILLGDLYGLEEIS